MKTVLSRFQQIYHSPKIAAILNFRFFFKNAKHKNACISKTLPDRSNSAKFFTQRVSVKTSLSKFQQIFHSPKMVAILNFRIFFKNTKHKNVCISKPVLDTAILMTFLTNRITLLSSSPNSQKNLPSQKRGSLSIFKFVTKSAKHQILFVSLTMQDRAISSKYFKHTVSEITTLPKNLFSYILDLLSYKQNFLT